MFRKISIAAILTVSAFGMTIGSASAASKALLPPKGKIWFGTNYVSKKGNLLIVGHKSVFHEKDIIAWDAHFNKAPGVNKITIALWSDTKSKLHELWHGTAKLKNKKDDEFANKVWVNTLIKLGANKVGAYVLSYSVGKHVLAAGAFGLEK